MSVHASTTSPPNTPSPPTPSCGNFWHYRCRLQNWELSLPPYPLAKMCHCPVMPALRLLAGRYHFWRGKLGRLTALVRSIIVCIKRMRGYNWIKEREQGSNIGRNHLFLEIFHLLFQIKVEKSFDLFKWLDELKHFCAIFVKMINKNAQI